MMEYRNIPADAPWSKEIVLETAASATVATRQIRLVHLTEGWKCAGSAAIWQDEAWAVRFDEDGAMHGQRFKTLDDARTRFNDMTQLPPAIIYVDGQEFIRCQSGDDHRALFADTVKKIGGEVALMVYKPRYGGYLREKMTISASKADT